MNDVELIAEYSRSRSEQAFAALVERYIRLVHSACWRQLRDAQWAEDATQQVFVLLSRKAGGLRHSDISGWLLTTAHYVCANMKRAESRRAHREQVVAMQSNKSADESADEFNAELLEMLDDGLLKLQAEDRQALVLRFLREQPLRQVGEALGLSEDAARKRVDRGLEKLRKFFQDRGIQTDSAALAVVLADQSHVPLMAAGAAAKIIHAARMAPSAAALSPQLVIAAAIVMPILLGAAGWGIFKWSTQQRVADSVAITPAATAPTPASLPAAPAPPAALDRSTPDNALASFCKAMEDGDRAEVYSCLLTDPNRAAKPIDASLETGLAETRMFLAAEKAYGPDASQLLNGDVPFSTVLRAMIVLRRLEGDTAEISGNTAIVRAQIPGAIIQAAPADAQQQLPAWSGKPVRFELRDGNWVIDMDRSIRFVMKIKKAGSSRVIQPADSMIVDILQEVMKGFDSITRRIADGELPSLDDAKKARQANDGRLFEKFGLAQITTYTAPVIAEKP